MTKEATRGMLVPEIGGSMHDFLIALVFLAMLVTPSILAQSGKESTER